MLAPLLDQAAGDRIGRFRILRRPLPGAFGLDLPLHLGREFLPHQLFGEIDRRRDQHQAGDRARAAARRFELARQQQRQPAAHRRADQHLRALGEALEHRGAVLQPAADGAVGEVAAGFAVAGIIEPDAGAAVFAGPVVERHRLGALHVGLEAAEPEQPGRGRRPAPAPRSGARPGRFPPRSTSGRFRSCPCFAASSVESRGRSPTKSVKVGDFSRERR